MMLFICFYYKARLLFYMRGQDLGILMAFWENGFDVGFLGVLIRICFFHKLISVKEQTYLCIHWPEN